MTQDKTGGYMQGSNMLSVCPATMNKVVQGWLDTELASQVEVKSVKQNGATDRFEIKFESIAAHNGGQNT